MGAHTSSGCSTIALFRFGTSKVSLEDVEAFSRHQNAEAKKPLKDRTNTNRWVPLAPSLSVNC